METSALGGPLSASAPGETPNHQSINQGLCIQNLIEWNLVLRQNKIWLVSRIGPIFKTKFAMHTSSKGLVYSSGPRPFFTLSYFFSDFSSFILAILALPLLFQQVGISLFAVSLFYSYIKISFFLLL